MEGRWSALFFISHERLKTRMGVSAFTTKCLHRAKASSQVHCPVGIAQADVRRGGYGMALDQVDTGNLNYRTDLDMNSDPAERRDA